MSEISKNMSEIVTSAVFPRGTQNHYLPFSLMGRGAVETAGIILAGISRNKPGYIISRKAASFHHVNIGIQGTGWYLQGSRKMSIKPGTFVVSPAHVPHSYGCDRGAWDVCWFHCADVDRWKRLRSSSPFAGAAPTCSSLKSIMEDYLREAAKGEALSMRVLGLQAELICEYLEEILRAGREAGHAAMAHRLAPLWQAVDASLDSPWSLRQLTSMSCMSGSQLLRATRSALGTTPVKMVVRLRMLRAQELLLRTDQSIKATAGQVGYEDEFAFSKAFKRFFGKAPREFRRQSGAG